MTILEQARAYIATLIQDNILKQISPAKVRAAFSSLIDAFQNAMQFVAPTKVKKSVSAITGKERSFSITLDNPSNVIDDLAATSISRRTLIRGEHFEVTGTGTSRIFQIIDTAFDNLSPGEKIYYWEKGKGADVGLTYPVIKVVTEAGVAKLKWRWPSETDADLRYIADMPIPSPYKTTDINHLDSVFGNRPLSTVLGSLTFQTPAIDGNTDWSTLVEGTYAFGAAAWQAGKYAPEKLYGYGIAVVRKWGNNGFVIQAFPHTPLNNYTYAILVRYPGADIVYSKWQYPVHLSETVNRFVRLIVGSPADSGEDLIVNGAIKLNGAQFGVTSLTKSMSYVPGAWCHTGFRGLGPGGDLSAQNASYLIQIAFDPAGTAGVNSGLYWFQASGIITASVNNNQALVGGSNVTLPVTLNQMAHAFNSRTVELRWELYTYAGGAPSLQVRVSGDTNAVAGTVPVYVKLRQIF